LRILDAGCGTGFSTLKLAQANPGAEIIAIDLSQSSLNIAQERLKQAELGSGVAFLQGDLQNLPALGLFDYIHSSGVIHHLPDPQAGLENLRAALAPQGLAYFMVYAAQARAEIQKVQQILYQLWQNPSDWREGLLLCRTFLQGLPEGHALKQHYRRALEIASAMLGAEAAHSDAFIVDTWLQRCEHLWSQPEWFALLKQTGWYPARWLDESGWQLGPYLPGLPDYIESLSPEQALALVDQLRPPLNFALFVSPEAYSQPELKVTATARPLAFKFIQLQQTEHQQLLNNGRGSQLSLPELNLAYWLQIDGQQSWQQIWAGLQNKHPQLSLWELQRFAQQLLDYGFVAQA
jgi:2-polyprenyl-3-methyl-5-hydroxy-6-metoxy-1,4-benzoquinol methylase